jgi:hypothetical protein
MNGDIAEIKQELRRLDDKIEQMQRDIAAAKSRSVQTSLKIWFFVSLTIYMTALFAIAKHAI